MFKFIHAADIHLDSPLRGLQQYEGAPLHEIRDAARRALANLVDLAIAEQVAFVLIAGDLYDGDWRDYNTGLYFVGQANRLREADIPLLLVAGNHDAENRMTRSLRLPENVRMFSSRSPESVILPELDVAVHGQSFATAAVHDNLARTYPTAAAGLFNIGLLHTCATGRDGHDRYAPCTIEDLRLRNYDYWALGHVHAREILCADPPIAFSGNVQGRHMRETGPKGCLLVEVSDDRRVDHQFRALDVLRWEILGVNVADTERIDDVLERIAERMRELCGAAESHPLAVRVELEGVTRAHRTLLAERHRWTQEIRSLGLEVGRGQAWVEKVKVRTTDSVETTAAERVPDGAIEELTSLVRQARADANALAELGFDMSDVLRKLPGELQTVPRMDDPEWLESVLNEAESRLLGELLVPERDE